MLPLLHCYLQEALQDRQGIPGLTPKLQRARSENKSEALQSQIKNEANAVTNGTDETLIVASPATKADLQTKFEHAQVSPRHISTTYS
jgi:hypothetical protein